MHQEDDLRIRPTCPACGGVDLIPVLYGHPVGEETLAAIARGELELGGRLVGPEPPGQRCRGCGAGV